MSTNQTHAQTHDCVIIGGGQCGLFAAKTLQERGLSHLVLEKDRVGQVWQDRLVGMKLFTSRPFCSLPDLPFPSGSDDFPAVGEMADYLKDYAKTFGLAVKENTKVVKLHSDTSVGFVLALQTGETIHAKTVINATGSNQQPHIPSMSADLSAAVQQFDGKSLQYLKRIPANSKVAVIGGGATGRQIAGGLATQGCQVVLATGETRGLPPNKILGKDLFWWLKKLGILFADKQSLIAKLLQKRNPVPCADFNNQKLTQLGVKIVGRAVRCLERTLYFAANDHEQESAEVDVVIWATGYQDATDWLDLPHCIDHNGFIQHDGKTPEAGFYLVGRKWLSCRASELVMGVERDVHTVVNHVERYLAVK